MKHLNFLWTALLVAALLTVGCSDDNEPQPEETVLKPVAEHITGKWQMAGFSVFENGKWEEQSNDDNVGMAMDFLPDSTEVRMMTSPDGFTALATRTWSVDETVGVLTDDNSRQRIHRLIADELMMEATQSMDSSTGEIAQKQVRWTFRRATEQDRTLAERLVGKWRFSAGYLKIDDEWKPVASVTDEAYFEFKEDGSCVRYAFVDNEEYSRTEYKWSANTAAGLLRLNDFQVVQIEMSDDDTLVTYFASGT